MRLPRIVLPGQPLHIIQRGNNRKDIFFEKKDRHHYLNDLKTAAEKYHCRIHAYVLMTNHVHLLVTPEDVQGPSRMMQAIGRRYVRYINDIHARTGTLWEGRFRSGLIDSQVYLLTCSRYIELNPVRANVVRCPGEYPWSSYRHNGLGKTDDLIEPHPTYLSLDSTRTGRQEAYRALFEHLIGTSALKMIRESTEKGGVIGNDRFKAEVERSLGRSLRQLAHGGDRKSSVFKNGLGEIDQ